MRGTARVFLGAAFLAGVLLAAAQAADPLVTDQDRVMGRPNAPVVLTEYASPSCPVCARFNAEILPQLKRDYIDTGKVRYVVRIFPLRPEDGLAERLARCAPADRYFAILDTIFRNQPLWDPENGVTGSRQGLLRVAALAGVSQPEAERCMDDTTRDGAMNQVAQEAVDKYRVNGTPTLLVNGAPQPAGIIPYDRLKVLLDGAAPV